MLWLPIIDFIVRRPARARWVLIPGESGKHKFAFLKKLTFVWVIALLYEKICASDFLRVLAERFFGSLKRSVRVADDLITPDEQYKRFGLAAGSSSSYFL